MARECTRESGQWMQGLSENWCAHISTNRHKHDKKNVCRYGVGTERATEMLRIAMRLLEMREDSEEACALAHNSKR
jgi:hypothetical protein